MRKVNFSLFTPLMRISILLTLSIITVHFCHGFIDTIYWLTATIMSMGIALAFKTEMRQSLLLHLCIFCTGALLTSHQMDVAQKPIQTMNEEDISSLDRTFLATQSFRQHIQQKMRTLDIQDQDFAIISAMTLGDKSALSKETKDIYAISGASHVLAVSGLHIGIIFQFFILLLGGRRRSPITIFFALITIWSYVVFIGMPTSAIRSATLISICCFSLLANKEALSVNNLCLAYVIMLTINPLYLFEISFQMSFIAVFSILLLLPSHPQKHGIMSWTTSMFRMSLAAQLGTIPLIAYYFGRISCYSLLTSFIAIPAASLLLNFSVLALCLALLAQIPGITIIATPLLQLVAKGLVITTQTCNTVLQLTTMLPMASIEGIKINIPQLCLIYTSIVVGYLLWKKRKALYS